MKYIVLQVDACAGLSMKVPLIFPNLLVHKMMAASFEAAIKEHFPGSQTKVVSAGEFTLNRGEAHGYSETLGVKSDPNDTRLIEDNDYGSGLIL